MEGQGPAEEYGDSPRQPAPTKETFPTISVCRPLGQVTLYASIYHAALRAGVPVQVDERVWAYVESCPYLIQLMCNLTPSPSSCGPRDLEILSEMLSWDMPSGIIAINIARQRSLICRPGQPAVLHTIESAMSWARRVQSVGVIMLPDGTGLPSYMYGQFFHNPYQQRLMGRDEFAHMFAHAVL